MRKLMARMRRMDLTMAITGISITDGFSVEPMALMNIMNGSDSVLFFTSQSETFRLFLVILIAYAVIKVFFSNLKRGGILIIQIAVGSLYMFSVPRGYFDSFRQWCKQVIALCLTTFLQSLVLIAGLMIFRENQVLGLGLMLCATEVPRICGQFGLDTTTKVNVMSGVYAAQSTINIANSVAKMVSK